MKNSRLIELITSLSKEEIKELSLYIGSPSVNKDEKAASVFKYIIGSKKPYEEITKAELKEASFGAREVNDVYFRVVITGLVKVIEKYFTDKKLEEDKLRSSIYLLETFRERGCRKSFNRHSREAMEKLRGWNEKDAYYYIKEAEYKTEVYLNQGEGGQTGKLLIEVDSNIELSYLSFKLDVYTRMLVMEISEQKSRCDKRKLQRVVKNAEARLKEIEKDHMLVYIKYISVKMLMSINENANNYFTKLRSYLKKPLPERTKLALYLTLISYCRLKRIVKRDEGFGKEELKIYKQMVKEYPEYEPSPAEAEAIISCARSEGEMVWAEGQGLISNNSVYPFLPKSI